MLATVFTFVADVGAKAIKWVAWFLVGAHVVVALNFVLALGNCVVGGAAIGTILPTICQLLVVERDLLLMVPWITRAVDAAQWVLASGFRVNGAKLQRAVLATSVHITGHVPSQEAQDRGEAILQCIADVALLLGCVALALGFLGTVWKFARAAARKRAGVKEE